MLPAALRWVILTTCVALAAPRLGFAATRRAVENAPRVAPTRPAVTSTAPLATRKIAGIEYVALADAAARLGLQRTSLERGHRAALSGPGVSRTELEADDRDAIINGLRVFLGSPVAEIGGELFVSRIDFERCLTPLLRPGLGVRAPGRPKVIAIDPGHGGRDNGKSNAALRVNEKTFTLDTAQRLKRLLEAAGFTVVLTRSEDTYVDLGQRAAIANLAKADLFVSIHFNALENDARTSGIEVFTFPPQFQNSAEAWSAGKRPDREDDASPVNAFDHWSAVLAQPMHRALLADLDASDRGQKLMHLKALRPLRCPGVLVECGFLTSDVEVRKIATPAYRQKIAEALCTGIRDYAATLERLQPRIGGAAPVATRARPSSG
jgi:N-acetylmuramoyl-L-alanine amidase